MKKKAKKRINVQDATLKNIRALKRRVAALEKGYQELHDWSYRVANLLAEQFGQTEEVK